MVLGVIITMEIMEHIMGLIMEHIMQIMEQDIMQHMEHIMNLLLQ